MTRLIINADELGLCASTNAAIEACHRFGTVSSTTVIVNLWDFDGAVRIARDNPALGVGAHLNLSDGKPVAGAAAVPTLVTGDGRFHDRNELLRRAFTGRVSTDDVRREWSAQLARLDRANIRITHLDCHEHVHFQPWLGRVLLELAQRRGLPVRTLTETFVSQDGGRTWLLRPAYLKRWMRSSLFGFVAARSCVPRTHTLLSIHGVSGAQDRLPVLEDYAALVRALPADGVSEMMVHPGRADETLTSFCDDGVHGARRREAEFGVLMSQLFKDVLARARIRLETFKSVA